MEPISRAPFIGPRSMETIVNPCLLAPQLESYMMDLNYEQPSADSSQRELIENLCCWALLLIWDLYVDLDNGHQTVDPINKITLLDLWTAHWWTLIMISSRWASLMESRFMDPGSDVPPSHLCTFGNAPLFMDHRSLAVTPQHPHSLISLPPFSNKINNYW